ncbi:MAG: SDR family oxidoreductase [Saprospiraceae bacterium]
MSNILLFGATGHAGRAIARELHSRGHAVTAVVRDEQKARRLLWGIDHFVVAEATQPDTLQGICASQEIVVSALGKSVSPNDWSRPSFEEVDFQGNMNILAEAKASGVQQFVYLSAFGAEQMRQLTYFRVHDDFSKALQSSGLHYAIVQPPAIMSAFLDLVKMARSGWLMTIGGGQYRTNPISEYDLAKICADLIGQPNTVLAAGGQRIYTRQEINLIIQKLTAPHKKVRSIPLWLVRSALPFWKIANRNMYDKLAFFTEVMEHDLLAPQVGTISLEDYFTLDKTTGPAPS